MSDTCKGICAKAALRQLDLSNQDGETLKSTLRNYRNSKNVALLLGMTCSTDELQYRLSWSFSTPKYLINLYGYLSQSFCTTQKLLLNQYNKKGRCLIP